MWLDKTTTILGKQQAVALEGSLHHVGNVWSDEVQLVKAREEANGDVRGIGGSVVRDRQVKGQQLSGDGAHAWNKAEPEVGHRIDRGVENRRVVARIHLST